MLLFLTALKLVCEIALLSLAGQALLYVLAGSGRDANLFYQLLRLLTRPFTAVVRRISPPVVLDRHVPIATFCLVALLWVVVTVEKIRVCMNSGMQGCT